MSFKKGSLNAAYKNLGKGFEALKAENARLREELAAAQKDAARYRWLRDSDYVYLQEGSDNYGWLPSHAEDIDYICDNAMKENNHE